LSSRLPTFSTDSYGSRESQLQSVYTRYNKLTQVHINAPESLCKLFEFHKSEFLDNYQGYYANKDLYNKEISNFCHLELLHFCQRHMHLHDEENSLDTDDSQMYEEELLSALKLANNPRRKHGFRMIKHPQTGHSGAEIYILHGHTMKKPMIAKVFRHKSLEGLNPAFLELSNSLIALSLTPQHINMPRIFSAGYTFFRSSKEYIFCMLFEKASGKTIKELLQENFIDNPDFFKNIFIYSAQFLAYFHAKSYEEFVKNNKVHPDVLNAEIQDRENFCRRRIRILSDDISFTPCIDFFNFKDALQNILCMFGHFVLVPNQQTYTPPTKLGYVRNKSNNGKFVSQAQPTRTLKEIHTQVNNIEIKKVNHKVERRNGCNSRKKHCNEALQQFYNIYSPKLLSYPYHEPISWKDIIPWCIISLQQHLAYMIDRSKSWNIPLKDRVMTHGDMHFGNLCCKIKIELLPLHWFSIIDPSSMKRSFGAIGDFSQDIGKYLASLFKEVALISAQKVNDQSNMEALYTTLRAWQDEFLNFYTVAYLISKYKMPQNFSVDAMAFFHERVYFYKLCLYAQFFSEPIKTKADHEARKILLYFWLRESGLLEQFIHANPAIRVARGKPYQSCVIFRRNKIANELIPNPPSNLSR
jgi:hypothetical protein